MFTYGGLPIITSKQLPPLISAQSKGTISISCSDDTDISDNSIWLTKELPKCILGVKSGRIGVTSATDGAVSSSISLINNENLATSTAWISISMP